MKVLNNVTTRNFVIDREFYTDKELFDMCKDGLIFSFDEDNFPCEKKFSSFFEIDYSTEFRVYTNKCKTINVVYDKFYDCYLNVVITNDNKKLYVKL